VTINYKNKNKNSLKLLW